jgi:hypothetical protein
MITGNNNSPNMDIDQTTNQTSHNEVPQIQNTPHSPPDIETVSLNDTDNQNENNPLYQIFIPRDSFNQQHSNADIRKQIREAFSVHTGDFTHIRWETYEHCTIFVIVLTSKIVYKKYVGKRKKSSNLKSPNIRFQL